MRPQPLSLTVRAVMVYVCAVIMYRGAALIWRVAKAFIVQRWESIVSFGKALWKVAMPMHGITNMGFTPHI